MKTKVLLISFICAYSSVYATGFEERFALAEDRASVLSELLPGSDETFYYRALHALNQGDFNGFRTVIDSWQRDRLHNWPPALALQLINREALLSYETDQQRSLKYLRKRLGLHFNHARRDATSAAELPSVFDNKSISRDMQLQIALNERPTDISLIDPYGYHLLPGAKLTNGQRFDLLKKLRRPDLNNLPDLILSDLKQRQGAHFGELPIHSALTLAQLDTLANGMPQLWRSEVFVNAYVARLAPLDEVNTEIEKRELDAYYQRVWQIASRLTPDFNSFKANLLYNWFQNDLKLGRVNKERFKEYLTLPRRAVYVPQPRQLNTLHTLDFDRNFGNKWLPPISNEEPLVRTILLELFRDAADYTEFESLLKTEYLRSVFAEAKLTAGEGDPEQWRKWMSRADYDALKRRVDVDFADDNPLAFAPGEQVELSVYIKNVKSLIVKVYEINTLNCYRDNPMPLDLAMNLNGLTATYEQQHEYQQSEFIRTRREFTFPELQSRGDYVVELIGNGKSSRALIQKGHLKVVEEITAAGHAFSVYDESNVRLKNCSGWFNGALFKAREDGRIYIPFADGKTDPIRPLGGRAARPNTLAALVVSSGDFASLTRFTHLPETYVLQSGFYVDREALIPGEQAEVLVRPTLELNGNRVALSLLENVTLALVATDFDGVQSRSVTPIDELDAAAGYVHRFRVPERCRALTFTLEASVENVAQNEEQKLKADKTFAFNAAEQDQYGVSQLFLSRNSDGYVLEARGKNGEPVAGILVQIKLKHRLFTREIQASLNSDQHGLVHLGSLNEITRISASWDGVRNRWCSWNLDATRVTQSSSVHGSSDSTIKVPVSADLNLREDVTLLEIRNGVYIKDWHSALSLKDGFLSLNSLPAGVYELHLKPEERVVDVRVTAAVIDNNFLISDRMLLGKPDTAPISIASVLSANNELAVKLSAPSAAARVHIIATRYLPEFDLFESLASTPTPMVASPWSIPACYYQSGRDIGDEHRYILERRDTRRYPGNMLERPGLLISPWSRQESIAERERVAQGGAFTSAADKVAVPASAPQKRETAMRERQSGSAFKGSCDFVAQTATVLYNLEPDEHGVVRIPLAQLRDKPFVRIALTDSENVIVRDFVRGASPLATRERRLLSALPLETAFLETQQVASLRKGESFEISGAESTRYQIYDSIAALYRLFAAINQDPVLCEFAFITDWQEYPIERKQELYSRYACHELNLFLYFKDREFFNKTVKTFIANKRDKRFIDDWLLDNDLRNYLSGLSFASLNAAERALLAHKMSDRKELLARGLREQVEIQAVDQEHLNRLFEAALQGGALDVAEPSEATAFARAGVVQSPVMSRGVMPLSTPTAKARFQEKTRAAGLSKPKIDGAREERINELEELNVAGGAVKLKADAADALGSLQVAAEMGARADSRRLFQRLESTKEWAENNYYKLSIEDQGADLIKPTLFWQEFAEHDDATNFLSGNVTLAANSFAEMMLALAVTDLPFKPGKHQEISVAQGAGFTAASPALVYYRRIQSGERASETSALVAQRFFRVDDRYRFEGNQRFDKIVTAEFLKGVVYGARVVLTNPTDSSMKLRQLLQIPQGAVPIAGGFYTKGFFTSLEPYSTDAREYYFYFPESGRYLHYPVTVSSENSVVGSAEPLVFNVVDRLTAEDKNSWLWISQYGTDEQVLEFLNAKNINRIDLAEIAWRMKDRLFFTQVVDLLAKRGVYNDTLWAYSIYHNVPSRIAEYMELSPAALEIFVRQCGLWLDAPLLQLDPVQHHFYEHLEYAPLVNPRAHKLGAEHKILNTRFRDNYKEFMDVLAFKPRLTDEDELAVSWAMTLQDRVSEALEWFDRVERQHIAEQVQYDYLDAYLAFYRGDVKHARYVASGYEQYPVDRWRVKFEQILTQVKEIEGEQVLTSADRRSRDQTLSVLAGTEPVLDMKIEGGIIKLKGTNLKGCDLNFYPMDIEPLFSRAPFVDAGGANFSSVRPALTQRVEIDNRDHWVEVPLPNRFAASNVMVEAAAAGIRRSQACYANTLELQLVERYGALNVRQADSGAPLPGVYVKVYARMNDGTVSFYKDGYTDLRGRFDYVSLNDNQIDNVVKFAVLVLSDELGAVVREARPPQKAQ